jgi:hypothetical protein
MERHWIHVCDLTIGWELRGHEGAPLAQGRQFADAEEATRVAIQLAREAWRANGQPSGVRVQSRAGPWHDVTKFGALGAGETD